MLPVLAALALVLLFWLTFRDRSVEPAPAHAAVKTSQATTHPHAADAGAA